MGSEELIERGDDNTFPPFYDDYSLRTNIGSQVPCLNFKEKVFHLQKSFVPQNYHTKLFPTQKFADSIFHQIENFALAGESAASSRISTGARKMACVLD